jgi:hypothetical protein
MSENIPDNTNNGNSEKVQDTELSTKETSSFESGWYLPGVIDPESRKREIDPTEEAMGLTAARLYILLEKLTSARQEGQEPSSATSEQVD